MLTRLLRLSLLSLTTSCLLLQASSAYSATMLVFGQNAGGTTETLQSGSSTTLQSTSNIPVAVTVTNLDGVPVNFSFSKLSTPFGVDSGTLASWQAMSAGTFSGNPIPEPASVTSFVIGMLGVIGYGLRRQRARKK